jgi:uncharacterized coiled-coil protein SlyX
MPKQPEIEQAQVLMKSVMEMLNPGSEFRKSIAKMTEAQQHELVSKLQGMVAEHAPKMEAIKRKNEEMIRRLDEEKKF